MNEKLLTDIKEVLKKDRRVVFAYLYGSRLKRDESKDIDIAVFSRGDVPSHKLSADLKVALYHRTGVPADVFDIRVINDIINTGDLFGLIFLKNILSENILLVDRSFNLRANFLELYGMRFRECEGLIAEVLW
jgi:predicted nucleotidyltransferase